MTCSQRIVLDRAGGSPKISDRPGFCPSYASLSETPDCYPNTLGNPAEAVVALVYYDQLAESASACRNTVWTAAS